MSPSHFGEKVVGRDAYDKAVRETKGGGETFGVRVRDTIPDDTQVNEKKRNTEHGALVVDGATPSGPDGTGDGVSIDQLKAILTENPTFFDSLYEAELARADGARPEALEVLLGVEIGIKGAGREDIINEIRALLGIKGVAAAALADDNKLRLQQRDEMAARNEENLLLADAPRVRALAQREEDLALVKKHQADKPEGSGDQSLARPLAQDSARATTLAASSTAGNTGKGAGISQGPKAGQIDSGTTLDDGTGDLTDGPESETQTEEKRLNRLTVQQLTKEARKAKVDTDAIEGTGADGAVLKKDLVQAILAAQAAEV